MILTPLCNAVNLEKNSQEGGKPRLTERSDLKLGVGAIGVLRATLWFTLFTNVYKVRS